MDISKESLFSHAAQVGIPENQILLLWESLKKTDATIKPSSISKWLFYFGALIIISAMTWLMGISWKMFGGGGIFLISLAYACVFICMGKKLWNKPDLRIPAGLFITIAVCMTPLAVYGLEKYFGIWPRGEFQNYFSLSQENWIMVEIATILTGLLALKFFPFPFLTAPIFFSAWLLTIHSVPLLTQSKSNWEKHQWITLFFGSVLMLISYGIHLRKKKDYAFWGYLFGLITFWTSLTDLIWLKGESSFFVYFLVNILLMFLSLLLKSRVFMVFGALGSFIYFSYLAYQVFENSILFPFVFSFIGLIIIYLGILYQRNIGRIERIIIDKTPSNLRKLLPSNEEEDE